MFVINDTIAETGKINKHMIINGFKKFSFVFVIFFIIKIFKILDIDSQVAEIQAYVKDKDKLNTSEILFMVENLDEDWKNKENILCMIVNHKDIEDIGLEIARLKSNIATSQVEDFNASLSLIRFYAKTYHHVMGTNLYNIL